MSVSAESTLVDAGRGPPFEGLARSFFERPVDVLAVALLGIRLVRRWPDGRQAAGRIVEVEAYGGPEDRASHARSGPTRRNATMFGPAGHAYVYRVYGLHTCLNVVGAAPGLVGAVLVRAVMPEGDLAAVRQQRDRSGRPLLPAARLAAGPGNVGAAVPGVAPEEYPTAGQEFLKAYEAEYGEKNPDRYAVYGYESMSLLLDAIKRAGENGADRAAVVDQLLATKDREGVFGTYSIDENGDITLTPYGVYSIKDDQLAFDRSVEPQL